MVNAAGIVASMVTASRVSSSIVTASIVASRAAWMVVTMRHRENRNRLVKKSMPLAKQRVFCAFLEKN